MNQSTSPTSPIRNIPKRPTDAELLDTFPEAKDIIPAKIRELEQQRNILVSSIKKRLTAINTEPDELTRWFCRKWLKLNEGEELLAIDKHLARLKRQLRYIQGFSPRKGALTDELIEAARTVPVESLLEMPLKRSGRTLTCCCPFHEERTPSFHVYIAENRAWCFGCNQGGDTIAVAMLLQDCSFKEAVLTLTGGQA